MITIIKAPFQLMKLFMVLSVEIVKLIFKLGAILTACLYQIGGKR